MKMQLQHTFHIVRSDACSHQASPARRPHCPPPHTQPEKASFGHRASAQKVGAQPAHGCKRNTSDEAQWGQAVEEQRKQAGGRKDGNKQEVKKQWGANDVSKARQRGGRAGCLTFLYLMIFVLSL